MSEDEWRSLLKPNTFYVAREKGTERPFTSPLYDNHQTGTAIFVAHMWESFINDDKPIKEKGSYFMALGTVAIQKPYCKVFEWSFSGQILCPVF
jgi:peptide methionine sulfoxide reductase MsrB